MTQHPIRRTDDSSGRFQPLWGPVVHEEVENPPDDPSASAAEAAYRKGYEDGLASAEASFAELIQRERLSIERELQHSVEARHLEAVQALSKSVAEDISTAASQIGDTLARAVCPFVAKRLSDVEHADLMRVVSRVVELKGVVTIDVEGPERFVVGVAEGLEARGFKVVLSIRDDADLIVKVDDVELRSTLPHWISRLEDIFR